MKIAQMPQTQQIEELLKSPEEGPVVMVNLLAYKKTADSDPENAREGETGAQAYGLYAKKMQKFV
jgi:hypothetical protein